MVEHERGTPETRKLLLKNLAAPFRRAGRFERILGVTRLSGPDPTIKHQLVVPHATYSPWWSDQAFMSVLDEIRDRTLIDVYRLYELWRLVDQTQHLDGDIVEVGVWRGGSGCLMASRAKECGLDATVYLCDTFEGVVKAGSRDNEYVGGEHRDTSSAAVLALAQKLGLDNIEILKGVFPEDTGGMITSSSLRLAHIDVDVYESARDSFLWVWERLLVGGVVVFDDYGFYSCAGVTRFVNEIAQRPDLFFFHNLNGHAVLVKR
jgi:O-methyltransferase